MMDKDVLKRILKIAGIVVACLTAVLEILNNSVSQLAARIFVK